MIKVFLSVSCIKIIRILNLFFFVIIFCSPEIEAAATSEMDLCSKEEFSGICKKLKEKGEAINPISLLRTYSAEQLKVGLNGELEAIPTIGSGAKCFDDCKDHFVQLDSLELVAGGYIKLQNSQQIVERGLNGFVTSKSFESNTASFNPKADKDMVVYCDHLDSQSRKEEVDYCRMSKILGFKRTIKVPGSEKVLYTVPETSEINSSNIQKNVEATNFIAEKFPKIQDYIGNKISVEDFMESEYGYLGLVAAQVAKRKGTYLLENGTKRIESLMQSKINLLTPSEKEKLKNNLVSDVTISKEDSKTIRDFLENLGKTPDPSTATTDLAETPLTQNNLPIEGSSSGSEETETKDNKVFRDEDMEKEGTSKSYADKGKDGNSTISDATNNGGEISIETFNKLMSGIGRKDLAIDPEKSKNLYFADKNDNLFLLVSVRYRLKTKDIMKSP